MNFPLQIFSCSSASIEPARLKATCRGTSMEPILKLGDTLHVEPYDGRSVRVGDVLVFVPPGWNQRVAHRVVSCAGNGFRTRGDNNDTVDSYILSPSRIVGQVRVVERGPRLLSIHGGLIGSFLGVAMRFRRVLDSCLSSLLRPVYHRLATSGLFCRLTPFARRTRVVSFQRSDRTELVLFWGKRPVGHFDPERRAWVIRRPFKIFVDEKKIQTLAQVTLRQ